MRGSHKFATGGVTRRAARLGRVIALSSLWIVSSCAGGDADKKLFFGDLHLHTRYSNDAFYLTTEKGLDEAYRFAKGEPLPRGADQKQMQLETPLDFLAVTEHAEFLGALQSFTDPSHPLYNHPKLGQLLRSPDTNERMKAWFAFQAAVKKGDPLKGFDETALKQAVWAAIVDAADRYNEPGVFTTFAAYEWAAYAQGGKNVHRNIIYEDTKNLPLPFTSDDSNKPEDLWTFLEKAREKGVEAITIPHNPNVSDGLMFALTDSAGKPVDAAYAKRRTRMEPVVEITQSKGTSETHPKLSPNDPFADFEIFPNLLVGYGKIGKVEGSYVREALMQGINQKALKGFNPFMFGFIGSSDSHSGNSVFDENNVTGFGGDTYDPTPASRTDRELWNGLPYWALSASGVTGVWAEKNTREGIFDALSRRETYATTGPRMRVRVFGGWDYDPDILRQPDWVKEAYQDGVSMGEILRERTTNQAPRLIVWAEKDPLGANLDRIQIIKGWSEEGKSRVKIFDVALSDGRTADENGLVPPVGNTVDVATARYTNDVGAPKLSAVWVDPEFDPAAPAFYYVRVIEIPTPRWTTYDAKALGRKPPDGVSPWIQERAFTSPIWYEP